MIRKYGIGLLALVIAVAAVAFTKPEKKPFTSHTFYYVAPGGTDYSESSVENKVNWTSNLMSPPTCNGSNKACQIDVDDNYTETVSGVRVFKTTGVFIAQIAAQPGGGSNYVPIDGSPSVGVTDKADRP
jgi:hypothetical protein